MWVEIVFIAEGACVDQWTDALLEAGASSVQTEDADALSDDEQALFGEPGEPAPASAWPHTRLTALIDAEENGERVARNLLARASALSDLPVPPQFDCHPVPDEDWVRTTQEQFTPFAVGRKLWITPSWHLPQDAQALGDAPIVEGRQALVLDPGLAFGTGSHPTTRLCLEWLDEHLRGGDSMIDYGCGSGILAIAALRLGATRVCGIDIDPQALVSARQNAATNHVSLELRSTADPLPAPADLVVANILANPLRVLAPLLESLVAPGGQLVLAGLLERQAQEIAHCYRTIELRAWRSLDGWTCLAGARRS